MELAGAPSLSPLDLRGRGRQRESGGGLQGLEQPPEGGPGQGGALGWRGADVDSQGPAAPPPHPRVQVSERPG